MKIAIISEFGHFECLGFLLETLKEFEITVYTHLNLDKYFWLDYYKSIFSFNIINNLNIDNNNNFNKIIKLTSTDLPYLQNEISILHIKNYYENNKKYLSLSPHVSGENITYTFPIFNPITYNTLNYSSKNITLIGYCLNNNIDSDTKLFIQNNSDYTFNFIVWGDTHYGNLKEHKNVNILQNINTNEMIKIINNSQFILSKKYISYDRFSGQLGLAMSFEKPIIIDSKSASTYNLPGITFNNNYSEIGKLSNISDEIYNNIVEKIKIFNKNQLSNNYNNIMKLL